MKIRLLSAALVAGMAATSVASAQEFDDRWYLSGTVGYNLQDEDRRTDDAYALSLGLENGFIQEGETASESFIPDFNGQGV